MDGYKIGKPLDKWLPQVLHYNRDECVISSDAAKIAYLAAPPTRHRKSSQSLLPEDPWDFSNIRKCKESSKPSDNGHKGGDWLCSMLHRPPKGKQEPLDPFAYLHYDNDESSSDSKTAKDSPRDILNCVWPLDANSQYGYDINDEGDDDVVDEDVENVKLSSRISTSHVTAPQDPGDEFGDSSDNFKPLFSDTPLDNLIPSFKYSENDLADHKSARGTVMSSSRVQKPVWKTTGLFSPIRNLRRRNKDVLGPDENQTPLSMLKVLLKNIQVEFKDPSKEIEKILESVPVKPKDPTLLQPKTYEYKPIDTARVDFKASPMESALPKTPLGPQRQLTQDFAPSRVITKPTKPPISVPNKHVDASEFDDIIFDAFMNVDENLPIKRLMHRQVLTKVPLYQYNFDTDTIEATQPLTKPETIEMKPIQYLKLEKLPTRSLGTPEIFQGTDGVDYLRSNVPSFEFGKGNTLQSSDDILADLKCPVNKLEGSKSHSKLLDDLVADAETDGDDLIPGNYELQSLLTNSRFALYDDTIFSSQMTSFCLDANQNEDVNTAPAEDLSSDGGSSPVSSVDDNDVPTKFSDALRVESEVVELEKLSTTVAKEPRGEYELAAPVKVDKESRLPPEPPITLKVASSRLQTPSEQIKIAEAVPEISKDESPVQAAQDDLEESPGDYWSRLASQKSLVYRKTSTDYTWLYESCEATASELLQVQDDKAEAVDGISATIDEAKATEPGADDLEALPSLVIDSARDIESVKGEADHLFEDGALPDEVVEFESSKTSVDVVEEAPMELVQPTGSIEDVLEIAELESIEKLVSIATVVEEEVQEDEIATLGSLELAKTETRTETSETGTPAVDFEAKRGQQLKQETEDEDLQLQESRSSLHDASYQSADLIKSFKFDSQTWGHADEGVSLGGSPPQPLTSRTTEAVQIEDELVCIIQTEEKGAIPEDPKPLEEIKVDMMPSKPIEDTKTTVEEDEKLPQAAEPYKETIPPQPEAVPEQKAEETDAKKEKKRKKRHKKKRKHRKKTKEAEDDIDAIQLRPLKNLVDKQLKEGFQATVYIVTSKKNATSSLCKVRFDYERDTLILETTSNTFDIQASKIVAEEIPTVPGAPILLKLSMKGKRSSAVVIQSSNARNLEVLGGTIGWANVNVKHLKGINKRHARRSFSSSSRSSTSSESSDDGKTPASSKQSAGSSVKAPIELNPLEAKFSMQVTLAQEKKPTQASKRGLLSRVLLRRKISNANEFK